MTAADKAIPAVTLPEGASLRRMTQVLLDAWAADPRRWMKGPLELREDSSPARSMPGPEDALDLFRLLAERQVDYVLVGGMAMLTYVKGRNTRDVDLLLSLEACQRVPELEIQNRQDFFARAQFRNLPVDLLFTTNPLFKTIAEKFATVHSFAELNVPTATVEGLIVLKLYVLPSLYRQFDWDRIYIYEGDVKALLARYKPNIEPLFKLLEPHLLSPNLDELKKIVSHEQQRIAKAERNPSLGDE